MDAGVFLNGSFVGYSWVGRRLHAFPDARTRAAIHAPTSKVWEEVIPTTFAPTNSTSKQLLLEVYNDLMQIVYS